AWLASDQHDYLRATQLFEESIALRHGLGDDHNLIDFLAPSARQARAAGEYQYATMLLEQALTQQRADGNRGSASTGGIGQTLFDLGLVVREQGDFARATTLFEEGLAFHQEINDHEGIAMGLMGLGDIARDQGDVAQVREYILPCLAIVQELGIQWAIGFAFNNLAIAAYLDNDLSQAERLIQECTTLFNNSQS